MILFVRSKKTSSQLPCLIHIGNNKFISFESILNAFASYFYSACNEFDHNNLNNKFLDKNNHCCWHVSTFTVYDVYKALKSLSNEPIASVDHVASFISRDCTSTFADPLFTLFVYSRISLLQHSFMKKVPLSLIVLSKCQVDVIYLDANHIQIEFLTEL